MASSNVVKAIIFDLDGTLLNTLEDMGGAVNCMLKEQDMPVHDIDAYRYFIGDGWRMLVTRALPENHRTTRKIEAGIARSQRFYEQTWNDRTRPYGGIAELLDGVKERNIGTAILTNKPHVFTLRYVEAYLSRWNFTEVLGQDARFPPKPDPSGALAIARNLQFEPAQFAFIGDSAVDVKTAHAAGMQSFGATWGFRGEEELLESGCSVLLKHPIDFLDFIV